MKRVLFIIILIIFVVVNFKFLVINLCGLVAILADLKYCGITETCNICIKTLRLMSANTGYSYEFLNVVLFIIIEPIIILILNVIAFFKNNIFKYIILLIIISAELAIFAYISHYYLVCSYL